jgi:hypothetical protein
VREKYQRAAAPVQQVGLLERDLLDAWPREGPAAAPAPTPDAPAPTEAHGSEARNEPAGAFRRIEAACVDLLFIGAIDFAIVWLTLQRCDLTFAQASQLPLLPLAAYLFLVDSGYLLMFTVATVRRSARWPPGCG